VRSKYQCFCLAKDVSKVVVCLRDRGEVRSSIDQHSAVGGESLEGVKMGVCPRRPGLA